MSPARDSTLADPQRIITDLRQELAWRTSERDAAQRGLDQAVAERDQALSGRHAAQARENAAGEVLQIINSSSSDLAPVFDAILDKATSLCEAAFGILWLYDGEQFHAGALHGAPAACAEVARAPFRPRPDNPLGRMLAGERLIVSVDVADEEPYRAGDPVRRALVELGGARSVIQVALVKGGSLLGSLTVYRQEVRSFTDEQVSLLENFAAQAVIAIENARLLTETREALDQQTATNEVLKAISRSAFDLRPILETAMENAIRLCGATRGHVLTTDGEFLRLAAAAGAWPGFVEALDTDPLRIGRGSAADRAAAERRVVQIEDVLTEPDYEQLTKVKEQPFRTVLAVPMLRGDLLLGVIVILKSRIDPFTERQIELIRTFADQAVIAIENARLITETREALEQQTATSGILHVVSRSQSDVLPVFEAIVESASRLCEAEFSAVARYDEGQLHLVSINNMSAEETRAFHSLFPRPVARNFAMGRAVVDGRSVQIEDVLSEPDYDQRTNQVLQSVAQYRTFLAIPIIREGEPIGVIGCGRRAVRSFTEKQIELVQTFADQAVIAIENTRLLTETREAVIDSGFLAGCAAGPASHSPKMTSPRWFPRASDGIGGNA